MAKREKVITDYTWLTENGARGVMGIAREDMEWFFKEAGILGVRKGKRVYYLAAHLKAGFERLALRQKVERDGVVQRVMGNGK